MSEHVLTLGGGCFWCLDAVFREVPGISSCTSGYAGGELPEPDYDSVCGGRTGHAEVVRLVFDPARVSQEQLLDIFFTIHDPTTLNRQGNDVGTQYRSVIFCRDPAQRAAIEDYLARLGASGAFTRPIVTEIADDATFWPAEDYHQDYFRRNPGQGYCQFVVAPKVAKYRQKWPAAR
ncbi:peptide-methionine (S)-S-oxide reductase MsrA [Amnimonas aquatica]|uniref:Peptide methionine sulfoxide reductase MsrA n=1 Tax=Amnimonas aquatica TaxID=2094561 RepID=A0A2P6AQG1_9GAMM|nr:peptide-methionine (S)-S-oxide reductase MsrA [Amnimonas aquatica]PQA29567.1 peptide-methionine (S)-S-oxide reductase [Amnimonas aquatica]